MYGRKKIKMLCEGAILIALAQILSILKVYEFPQGGSVTLAMLPVILFATRWGLRAGLLGGFSFGILQLVFDGAYAWGWQSMIGDYILAFAVLGLAGIMCGKKHGFIWGCLIGSVARFLVHYVVGATIWAEYMPETFGGMVMTSPWFYSILYNGAYMLPCAVATIIVAIILDRLPTQRFTRGQDLA